MSEYAFRQAVRDEVLAWIGQQQPVFQGLIMRIGDEVAPICVREVRRSLLVRLGELQGDERARVVDTLVEARKLLGMPCPPGEVGEAERVRVHRLIQETLIQVSQLTPPPAAPPAENPQSPEEF